ncbi:MAG: glycosyl hydrolase, partial [Armatimonadota bacterium]
KYIGVRWLRAGIEGDVSIDDYTQLHKATGVRFSWGLGSGGSDIRKLISTARQVAAAGMLLAFEGPNEPNNWRITYNGEVGGGDGTWLPVAKLQRDLYTAVKSDPMLRKYPVWSISENGAETDNVGLQFLTIPKGSGTLMPDGTKYADYANCHNYISHPAWPGLHDNQTWIAADPTPACKVDGLYGNYGLTWRKRYSGYSSADLLALPRVTTETGILIGDGITEELQGCLFLTMYLAQFKRGWSYTCIYLLRDRTDEAGNQQFGFYRPDHTPRKAADYLHNLTTILADKGTLRTPGRLNYTIANQPETVHDLLLQKSSGAFELVVWNERFGSGASDDITLNLGARFASVRIYDPTVGTSSVETLTNVSSVKLTLSNHPVIVELEPRTTSWRAR